MGGYSCKTPTPSLKKYKDFVNQKKILSPIEPSACRINDIECAFEYSIYNSDNKKAVFQYIQLGVILWLASWV